MTVTDWVLAAALILAVLYGWRLGTINVIAKIGALLLAYRAARAWSGLVALYVSGLLPGLTANEAAAENEKLTAFLSLFIETDSLASRLLELACFVIIFVIVCWVVKKIAYALTGLFGRGLLGQINRALGACCAGILLLALVLILADIIFPAAEAMGLPSAPADFLADSALFMPLLREVQGLF